jgi:hypothetical protein
VLVLRIPLDAGSLKNDQFRNFYNNIMWILRHTACFHELTQKRNRNTYIDSNCASSHILRVLAIDSSICILIVGGHSVGKGVGRKYVVGNGIAEKDCRSGMLLFILLQSFHQLLALNLTEEIDLDQRVSLGQSDHQNVDHS